MSDTTFAVAVPTRWERCLRRCGFVYHLGDEPETTDTTLWSQHHVRVHFDALDRIRLLITGKLHVVLTVHSNADASVVKTRTDWEIHP